MGGGILIWASSVSRNTNHCSSMIERMFMMNIIVTIDHNNITVRLSTKEQVRIWHSLSGCFLFWAVQSLGNPLWYQLCDHKSQTEVNEKVFRSFSVYNWTTCCLTHPYNLGCVYLCLVASVPSIR